MDNERMLESQMETRRRKVEVVDESKRESYIIYIYIFMEGERCRERRGRIA